MYPPLSKCLFVSFFTMLSIVVHGQHFQHSKMGEKESNQLVLAENEFKLNDSLICSISIGYCKSAPIVRLKKMGMTNAELSSSTVSAIGSAPKKKPALLKVHGNVLYDFYYQSSIDTPFAQKDVYQHTVQTFMDVTVKDSYPFRLEFTARSGNSYLFRDLYGVNFQFNSNDFKNRLRDTIQKIAFNQVVRTAALEQLKDSLDKKANELYVLKHQMQASSQLQKLVEQKESELFPRQTQDFKADSLVPTEFSFPFRFPGKDRFLTGMAKGDIDYAAFAKSATPNLDVKEMDIPAPKHNQWQQRFDSLQRLVAKLDSEYRRSKVLIGSAKRSLPEEIDQIKDPEQLKNKLRNMQVADSLLPKGYKTLMAIKTLGIGRSLVDYSELTAKNISVTGLQVEYNPGLYYAVASGVVDYQFRNFVVSNRRQKQYLSLFRIGTGMKDGNHVILTYYAGKKEVYNFNTNNLSTPNSGSKPNYHIMGVALEGRIQLTQSNYVVAEVAKSTMPYYNSNRQEHGLVKSALRFNNRSNEAYSMKLCSFFPVTQTTVNGMYKRMGAHFQSFSLFTSGSSQNAWSVKIDQPFFKQSLTVSAAIRKNDFSNPYIEIPYKSSTVFKSIQATMRLKKWPTITAGYYPSSQVTKVGAGNYSENLYYTLVGTGSYFYRLGGVSVNTTVSYTRFYNEHTDSNFLYFNSKNMLLSHQVFLRKLTLGSNLSAAFNPDYRLYVADGSLHYKLTERVQLGGGLKYNRQTVINNTQLGYSANALIQIPKLGAFQLLADKGFIPGMNKQLVPNNSGRLTYSKTF